MKKLFCVCVAGVLFGGGLAIADDKHGGMSMPPASSQAPKAPAAQEPNSDELCGRCIQAGNMTPQECCTHHNACCKAKASKPASPGTGKQRPNKDGAKQPGKAQSGTGGSMPMNNSGSGSDANQAPQNGNGQMGGSGGMPMDHGEMGGSGGMGMGNDQMGGMSKQKAPKKDGTAQPQPAPAQPADQPSDSQNPPQTPMEPMEDDGDM